MRNFINIFNNIKGITLVEIIVALSIMSAITLGLSMSVNMILNNVNLAKDKAFVTQQVENAGFWMTRDIQRMSGYPSSIVNGTNFSLSLKCFTGETENSTEDVSYALQEGKLMRNINGTGGPVALYVTQASIVPVSDNRTKYVFNISVSYGKESISETYEIEPRKQ